MQASILYFLLLATSAQAGPVGQERHARSLGKRHGFMDGVNHAVGGGNGRHDAAMNTEPGRPSMNRPKGSANGQNQRKPSQDTRPGREAVKELDDPPQSAPKFEGLRISTVTQTVTPIPAASTVTVTAGNPQNNTLPPSAAAPSDSSPSLGDAQPCVVLLGSDPKIVCGGTTVTPKQIIYDGTSSTAEPDPTPNADGNGVGVSVISMPEPVVSTTTTSTPDSLPSTSQTTSATQTPPPPPPPAVASSSSDSSSPAAQTTSSSAVPQNPPLNAALPFSDSIALGKMSTTTPATSTPTPTPDAANLFPAQPIVNLGGLKLDSVLDLGSLVKSTPAAVPPA